MQGRDRVLLGAGGALWDGRGTGTLTVALLVCVHWYVRPVWATGHGGVGVPRHIPADQTGLASSSSSAAGSGVLWGLVILL